MRHMVTCFSEHAVRISELSCSSSSSSTTSSTFVHNHPSISPSNCAIPSVQNAVVYLYKTPLILSPDQNNNNLLITVTWCRNQLTGQGGLSITFPSSSSSSSAAAFKLSSFSRLFRKKKGQKTLEVDSAKIDIFWDLSQATYHSGPEPVDGYYVLVTSGSQLGLALGDLAREAAAQRFSAESAGPDSALLISRREHYSGGGGATGNANANANANVGLYCSTAAQFCESGGPHEIVIRCGEEQGQKHHNVQPVLSVSIDKRTVIKIRRLQWNFRGNQTVFVDGVLVDLMWDVHDWFFGSGQAVFMLKTRNGLDSSRLWLEDKLGGHKDNNTSNQDSAHDFSLLIYASKNP